MLHEKDLLQYIVCAGDWCDVLLLGPATIKAHVMLVMSITGIFLGLSILDPYLCAGFDCGLCMSTSIIAWAKKQECHPQQDDYAYMLLLASVIVAITFWWLLAVCNIIAMLGAKTFFECHVIESM